MVSNLEPRKAPYEWIEQKAHQRTWGTKLTMESLREGRLSAELDLKD